MRKGFIFDHNKCVGCGACTAGCVLENGWSFRPRMIYTFNSEVSPAFALTNLSLACNHCETADCLIGCPASAYFRDTVTGGVIIDENKCIGCKYCQWNCPYNAPKFDIEKRITGKCNLCYSGLIEGRKPACVTSCPTGALDYEELTDPVFKNSLPWFPEKDLNPAISFTNKFIYSPLRIIPENLFPSEYSKPPDEERRIASEWSLAAFSFLTTLSVATAISSVVEGTFPGKILFISMIILAGLISIFHLGKPNMAWKAAANFIRSPLSREIIIFVIYTIFSGIAVMFSMPGLLFAASVCGLILLIVIDNVYIFSDKRSSVILHSGQTFLSALLIVSFLEGAVLPFIFIALIRFFSSVYKMSVNSINSINFGIRFMRIAILLVSGVCLLTDISTSDPVLVCIFLTGELFDRLIFYIDFNPLNINSLMSKHLNVIRNEKKGC
jgi:Fe-S-cluster-containing dehydrogenase component